METEKITFEQIMESEKQDIENKILENNTPKTPSLSKIENSGQEKKEESYEKGKSKFEMIQDLQNLEKTLGLDITEEKKLKRWSKAELAKRIADLLSGSVKKIEPLSFEEKKNDEIIEEGTTKNNNFLIKRDEKNAADINTCVMGLYRMNLIVAGLLENSSILMKHHTADIPLLEGFCGKIDEQKGILLDVFKDMYLKYREELNPYLSPLSQYGIIMGATAMSVASNNLTKKKQESGDK